MLLELKAEEFSHFTHSITLQFINKAPSEHITGCCDWKTGRRDKQATYWKLEQVLSPTNAGHAHLK